MLSTTRNKFQYLYVLAAISIFALILAIMTFRSGALPAFSAAQPAAQNLTTLSATDVTAYRWQAMADFYAAQQAQIPVTGGDLTTLSAADISAYRWQAMADFYTNQAATAVQYGPPGR
jgi:hypothetical protein